MGTRAPAVNRPGLLDRIAFGPVTSTLMGCDGQRGQVEALFLTALDGATTWRQTESGELEIRGDMTIEARPGIAASSGAIDPGGRSTPDRPAAPASVPG